LGEELGNKNGYDLSGYRKMYANKKQIVYSIKDEILLINIISIGKRDDMEVYANAAERV
jgi:mRNA interferase RelE/StbE